MNFFEGNTFYGHDYVKYIDSAHIKFYRNGLHLNYFKNFTNNLNEPCNEYNLLDGTICIKVVVFKDQQKYLTTKIIRLYVETIFDYGF